MFKVILADDEPRILQALEQRVDWSSLGLEIAGTATNGQEGLELVTTYAPDLLVTDIRMPGLNGIELAKAARRTRPEIEIILISGFSEFSYAREGIELGVLGYLLKPIQQAELEDLLHRAVDALKKKRDDVITGWYQFRSFVARAQASGRLHEHLVQDGIIQPGGSVFCLIGTGSPHPGEEEATPGVYRRQVSSRVIAHFVSGTQGFCSDAYVRGRNYYRQAGGTAGVSTVISRTDGVERMITEAESAFVRAHFASDTGYLEFRRGDPDLGPLVRDAVRSLERQQYETAATLINTLHGQSRTPGSNSETLLSLYNALVVQTRSYYSLSPATGLLPRPLNGVVELPFRYASLEDVFEALNSMLDYLRRTDTGEHRGDGNTMIHVREYIENHFSEELSMDHLADTFDLDKNQLSQRFKHTHGTGVSEFVRTTRIDHARFLLRTTTMPISTIGELCGYSDYYYFARVFKRETGVTCSQFREEETRP